MFLPSFYYSACGAQRKLQTRLCIIKARWWWINMKRRTTDGGDREEDIRWIYSVQHYRIKLPSIQAAAYTAGTLVSWEGKMKKGGREVHRRQQQHCRGSERRRVLQAAFHSVGWLGEVHVLRYISTWIVSRIECGGIAAAGKASHLQLCWKRSSFVYFVSMSGEMWKLKLEFPHAVLLLGYYILLNFSRYHN